MNGTTQGEHLEKTKNLATHEALYDEFDVKSNNYEAYRTNPFQESVQHHHPCIKLVL